MEKEPKGRVVTDPAEFRDLVAAMRTSGKVGFDTEFVGERTYFPRLCLIQLGTEAMSVAVDPLAVGDLSPLDDLLFDASVLKLVHAGWQDLKIIHQRTGRVPAPVFDTARLRGQLLDHKVDPDVVTEAYRLDGAYQAYYDNEPLRPLAVEIRAEAEGISTRYDLIAEVVPNEANLPPGTWIVEHKTASRADVATLEGWQNDGQILGHMWIYHHARLVKRYGPLAGVMVNVVVKTKVPQLYRIMVPVSMARARDHVRDLRMWESVYRLCEVAEFFPRNRKSCIHFGRKCEFFDHCAEEP